MTDFIPPQALDAEASLLGGLLTESSLFELVDGVLWREDFYVPAHEIIFENMMQLRRMKKPVDKISLAEALREKGQLDRIGGPAFLSELMYLVQTAESVEYFVKLIREKSTLRSVIRAGREIQELGFSGESDVEQTLEAIERLVREVSQRGMPGVDLNRQRQLQELYGSVAEAGTRTDWLTTPWPTLDLLTGGFDSGELIVWVAAPKVGKSGVVLTLADHVARIHGATALFAAEMNRTATIRRHMAQLSGVSARKQRQGQLSEQDWEHYADAMAQAGDTPLYVFGREDCSLLGIRRALRELRRKEGAVKSIVVDHVGFLSEDGGRKNESQHEKMNRVYRSLLEIADEFSCPLHAVQHTSRAGYSNGSAPSMANIRDGGNPEGHAHAVIFVHRPFPFGGAEESAPGSEFAKMPLEEQKEIGEFIILASRDGEAGTVPTRYRGYRNFWYEDTARINRVA